MALTDRQRRLYASAPRGEVGRAGLSLTHPGFSRAWHLTNAPQSFAGRVGGVLVNFEVHPFRVLRPEISASGRSDLKIDLYNSGPDFSREWLAAAAQPDVPVRVELNDYLPGDDESQIDPIVLWFVDVALSSEACSGTAASVDFLNLDFPRVFYELARFPGLDR